MIADSLYLGVWFQRTHLHLQEMYHFFKSHKGIEGLAREKLIAHWKSLAIKNLRLHEEHDFDYIRFTSGAIEITIFEDGIILLRTSASAKDFKKDSHRIEEYYSKKLGTALAYLFSRGAPLPKELNRVSEAFPLLYVRTLPQVMSGVNFIKKIGDSMRANAHADGFHSVFGERVIVVDVEESRSGEGTLVEELVQNFVFFREFERQLGHYLSLHRTMWDNISHIRNSHSLRYKDFPVIREQMLSFLETMSFVSARLKQMEDILSVRTAIVHPHITAICLGLGMRRHAQLKAEQAYVRHLWQMTVEYVERTLDLLDSLFQENTQRELSAMRFIILLSALTSFFGMNIAFPWEERWMTAYPHSFAVVSIITIAAIGLYYFLKFIVFYRKFVIRERK